MQPRPLVRPPWARWQRPATVHAVALHTARTLRARTAQALRVQGQAVQQFVGQSGNGGGQHHVFQGRQLDGGRRVLAVVVVLLFGVLRIGWHGLGGRGLRRCGLFRGVLWQHRGAGRNHPLNGAHHVMVFHRAARLQGRQNASQARGHLRRAQRVHTQGLRGLADGQPLRIAQRQLQPVCARVRNVGRVKVRENFIMGRQLSQIQPQAQALGEAAGQVFFVF